MAAFGTVDASGANFTYTIDNLDTHHVDISGKTPSDQQAVLFSSSGLSFGEHTLFMSTVQDGPTLLLEYISFTGAPLQPRNGGSRDVTDTSGQSSSSVNNRIPPGTIALIVLCSVLFLVVLAVGGLLLYRRKHRWQLDRPMTDPSFKERGFDILPNGARFSLASQYQMFPYSSPHYMLPFFLQVKIAKAFTSSKPSASSS